MNQLILLVILFLTGVITGIGTNFHKAKSCNHGDTEQWVNIGQEVFTHGNYFFLEDIRVKLVAVTCIECHNSPWEGKK